MFAFLFSVALALQTPTPTFADLVFSIELQDPIVHHLKFSSNVVPGEAFSFEIRHGDVECLVSGTVPAPSNGVYIFPVEVDESHGPKTSMKGSQTVNLSLDKPYSAGPASSFIYIRTFKLSRSNDLG